MSLGHQVSEPIFETLRGLDALEAIRAEWNALCDRAPGVTPFQRPAWLIPWARAFAGEPPEAIALRLDGRLAGLLLALRYREGAERVVTLLGAGLSDYLDAIVDPVAAGAEGELLVRLLSAGEAWNECRVEALRDGSPLLDAPLPESLRAELEPLVPSLVLPLDAGLTHVPRRNHQNLRTARHRAEKLGEVRYAPVSAENLERHLEGLFFLHAARWSTRAQPGMLADPAVQAFHREVVRASFAEGRLVLDGLWIAGQLAAVLYGFFEKQRVYFYLHGFDPKLERASPGALLIEQVARRAVREGCTELDFLRGVEPYKLAWGASERLNFRRRIRSAVF